MIQLLEIVVIGNIGIETSIFLDTAGIDFRFVGYATPFVYLGLDWGFAMGAVDSNVAPTEGYTFRDPTVNYSRTHVVPTLWDELARSPDELARPDPVGQRIVDEAREFGLAKGLSVPLHGLGCQFGMMSYAASDPNHPITESTVCAEAMLLATYVHQAASNLMFGSRMRDIRALSSRERECLKWAAEGKSGWDIAHLLAISERTVVFHLRNACSKLGVATRQQAVAKAMVLGLLD